MADTSLDDFFAKKDKSKKKPKVKTGDGNTGTPAATKAVKKEKKKDKDKLNTTTSSGNKAAMNNGQEDDDDWNDFEEEKAVDYSGLRIQNLQIAKDEPEKEGDGEEEEYDEDGEVKERRDASGPWKKGSAQTPAPAPVPEPVKEEPVATPKAPAKYIPPAQRHAANTSTPSFPSRRKKEAPNLHSEVDFPTLGGTPGQGGQDDSSSYIIDTPNQRRGANLTLENKFSALQD